MKNTGIIAAGHPATADAGAAILRAGGNAIDAAIAAVTTSFCAEPVLTSPGGGGFMLIANKVGNHLCFDGFTRMPAAAAIPVPAAASGLQAVPIDFGDSIQTFHIGPGSVGAPSLLAMLFKAHKSHGKIPLKDALAPGIDAARSGIRLNNLQASFIQLLQPILTSTTHCQAIYAPGGKLLSEGDNFSNIDLANTLEMLTHEGINEMYYGDLARHIVAACLPYGLLNMDDMKAQQVHIRQALATPMFGGTLLTNPPPSAGGLLIAFAATLLENISKRHVIQHINWPTRIAAALRTASHIRHQNGSQAGLNQRIHEANVATEIMRPDHIQHWCDYTSKRLQQKADENNHEYSNRNGSTTHISIIDKDGLAVSLTSSNGEGSGIVVPGTGIHLNNMLGEDDINPLGLHKLAAGLSLSSMMAPSIFMKDGSPALILGSGGSNRLRSAILQVLTHHLMHGKNIETAIHAPRLHNEGNRLDIEPGCFTDHDKLQCMQQGWTLNEWKNKSVYFGGVNAISRSSKGQYHGCADPRRGGAVAYAKAFSGS